MNGHFSLWGLYYSPQTIFPFWLRNLGIGCERLEWVWGSSQSELASDLPPSGAGVCGGELLSAWQPGLSVS